MIGCNNRHSSTGIHPITVSHNSFTRIRIIIMITLILDKFALVKVGFSIRDPVHQGPGRSTPRWIAHPEGFALSGKAV
jgi:hypothetical protein